MDILPIWYPECFVSKQKICSSPRFSEKKFLPFLVGVELFPRKLCGGCLQVSIKNASAYGWCHPPSLAISVFIIYFRLENAVERWLILDFRLGGSHLGTVGLKEAKARLLLLCFSSVSGPRWKMMQDLDRNLGTRWKIHVLVELMFHDRSYWPAKEQIWDTWLSLTYVTMPGCSQPSKPRPLKTIEKYIRLLTDGC